MDLYLIERPDDGKYSVYRAAVVAARTTQEATLIHPGNIPENILVWVADGDNRNWLYAWVSPQDVAVTRVGRAARGTRAGRVVLAEFLGD